MFKMLQITENISWSKESALQPQAMENTAWQILAPKWSPWDCIYPCIIKLVSMVFSCSMLFSFGTWIWNWEEHSWVQSFPCALHQKSTKYLKCPDCTELLKHWDGTAALPNSILCPEKTKAGFKVTKCWWWQPKIAWFAFRRLRWGHHTTGTATGWRLKPRNGDFAV